MTSFKKLFCFDISNFYGTIYSHTIAWLFSSTDLHLFYKKNNIGVWFNQIDTAIQNAKGSRTHGLPTGTMVLHDIAESYLRILDAKLFDYLNSNNIRVTKMQRRSDNYEILVSFDTEESLFFSKVSSFLIHYELCINPNKKMVLFNKSSEEINNVGVDLDVICEFSRLKMPIDDVDSLLGLCRSCYESVPVILESASNPDIVDPGRLSEFANRFLTTFQLEFFLTKSVQSLCFLWLIAKTKKQGVDYSNIDVNPVFTTFTTLIKAKSSDPKEKNHMDPYKLILKYYNSNKHSTEFNRFSFN